MFDIIMVWPLWTGNGFLVSMHGRMEKEQTKLGRGAHEQVKVLLGLHTRGNLSTVEQRTLILIGRLIDTMQTHSEYRH